MKYSLLVPVVIFFFAACKNVNTGKDSISIDDSTDKGAEARFEQESLRSGKITDSILLGFKLGMSEKQFEKHYLELRFTSEDIKQDYDDDDDYYLFKTSLGNFKGYLRRHFFNDSLSKLSLVFKNEQYPILVSSELEKVVTAKYGEFKTINSPFPNYWQRIWFSGTLKVMVGSGQDADIPAVIEYSDLRTIHRLEAKDSLQKDSINKATQKVF